MCSTALATDAHAEHLFQCLAVHLVAGPSTRGIGSRKGSSLQAAAAELDAHQYVHRPTLTRKDQRPSLQDIFADQPDMQLEVPPDSAQATGRLPQSAPSASSGRRRLAQEEAAVQVWRSRAPLHNRIGVSHQSGFSQQGDCHR